MVNKKYNETIALCTGAQNKTDVPNWTTLYDFDSTVKNKDFDFRVYKQGNRIVLAFAGTNPKSLKDWKNGATIYKGKIPEQYGDAERLYNTIKADSRYKNCNIEFVGYSLGGSISDLLSYRTGLPSHSLAPAGSKHIAEANKNYFKFGDANITCYGKKGDIFFGSALFAGRQAGKIIILPDLKHNEMGNNPALVENHYLHNFGKEDMSKAYVQKIPTLVKKKQDIYQKLNLPKKSIDIASFSGWRNPVTGNKQIYTKEYIEQMSSAELESARKELYYQALKIGIPSDNETTQGMINYGNTIHVKGYTRADGTVVRSYVRSL